MPTLRLPCGSIPRPPLKTTTLVSQWQSRPRFLKNLSSTAITFSPPYFLSTSRMAPLNTSSGFIPSESMQLLEGLNQTNPPSKWGFNIYLTTYQTRLSETVYPRLKSFIQTQTRQAVESTDAPELLQTMAWDFFDSSPSTLNSISLPNLRKHFKSWAEKEPLPTPKPEFPMYSEVKECDPRFLFFMFIDEECLQSFADAEKQYSPTTHARQISENAFVKFAELEFKTLREKEELERERCERGGMPYVEYWNSEMEEEWEPVDGDGLREPDVGWMKVELNSLCPSFFFEIDCIYPSHWENNYVRPPGIFRYH